MNPDAILHALGQNDLITARKLLVEDILEQTTGKSSWDSPQYSTDKTVQNAIALSHERSDLFTYSGLQTLADRYFLRGNDGKIVENPQSFFARVATGIALAGFKDEGMTKGGEACYTMSGQMVRKPSVIKFAQKLYDIISKFHFMPATPVLTNIGTTRGLPISCFLGFCGDSMDGITGTNTENAFISKGGGGIGTYWGAVRHAGAKLSTGGKSSGIMPFLKITDAQVLAVNQGGNRRGAAAVYLDIWHPEIEAFIEMRKPTGGDENRRCLNLNHGIVIDDAFMEAAAQCKPYALRCPKTKEVVKEIDAHDLLKRILQLRLEHGEPYLLFIDTVKEATPIHHVEKGLYAVQSNLCVAPETMVLTNKGSKKISSLMGKTVQVWNGEEWSETTVYKTGEDKELFAVSFSDGSELNCTPYHKFYIQEDGEETEVQANELKRGDCVVKVSSKMENSLIKVVAVTDSGRRDDTYCFNEPKRHRGVFNGILTGQCSEIVLPTSPDRTAVCCLGSMNLETYKEWKDCPETIYLAVRALDNVLETFIHHADHHYEKSKRSAAAERSVGLGVMGYHGMLMGDGIPLESLQARLQNKVVFKDIHTKAVAASRKLAKERGVCPDAVGTAFDQRNSYILAIAPTATISQVAGNSTPGIEPIAGNAFTQKTLSGSFLVKNRYLSAVLAKYGKDDQDTWSSIISVDGSVQHLDFLDDDEKKVFRTAFEMNQREIIAQACDRQKFICQAQSLNLFYDVVEGDGEEAGVSMKYMWHCVFEAWAGGAKSLYYVRSRSILKADNEHRRQIRKRVETEECAVCQ